MPYFWICLGSALGGGCRYWISGAIAQRYGESFPTGTVCVNVSGCLLIGLIAGLSDPGGRFMIGPVARQFLMVGVMGGYTTFSSFSLQTLTLMQDGEWFFAGLNVVLSVVLCLIAVWLGNAIGVFLNLKS